ncbi:hypothetical protein [uncultured Jatrophihabitans sp.]|uniref:hypothetical protein n=1 Tax=uncultured Jatrophihabitans sp. TaxID=1610747 RepID=UPI0035CBE169
MLDLSPVPELSVAVRRPADWSAATGPVLELSNGTQPLGEAVLVRLSAVSRFRRSIGGPGLFPFTTVIRDPAGEALLSAAKNRQSLIRKAFEVDVRAAKDEQVGIACRGATRAGVTVFTGPAGQRWAVAGVSRFRGWTVTGADDGPELAEVELADVAGRRKRRAGAPLRRYRVRFAEAATGHLRALIVADLVCTDLALFPRGTS